VSDDLWMDDALFDHLSVDRETDYGDAPVVDMFIAEEIEDAIATMVRVEAGLPIKPLPLIIPEPRRPPAPGTDPTPMPPADGGQPSTDPFTAVLQQLLGNGN